MAIYKINYVREMLSDSAPVEIVSPKHAINYLLHNCYNKDEMWREQCYAIYVNKRNQILGHLLISFGGTNSTAFDKKLVIKGALDCMAHGIIISHNHPEGNCMPSKRDIDETERLRKACGVLDIILLDHIILGEKDYYSFADEMKRPFPDV